MSPLLDRYEGIVCDLDGVVYRGADAVPHAVDALDTARRGGVRIAYATNNAARPPHVVRTHLEDLGLTVGEGEVVTSSMAGAHRLAELLPAGSIVLAIGGEGVPLALEAEGLVPVRPADVVAGEGARPVGVLQGFGPDVGWKDLAQGAFAVQGGARWIATNADLTIPVADGIAPGNGSLVGALRHAVDVDPEVVGKPHPPLYLRAADALGCAPARTLAIGDRLDTDIEGAGRTGMDSLFVFTGVDGPRAIIGAEPLQRPTYLAADLRALHEPYTDAEVTSGDGVVEATCDGATVRIADGRVDLRDGGSVSSRLRAVVAAARAVPVDVEVRWPDVDAWARDGER